MGKNRARAVAVLIMSALLPGCRRAPEGSSGWDTGARWRLPAGADLQAAFDEVADNRLADVGREFKDDSLLFLRERIRPQTVASLEPYLAGDQTVPVLLVEWATLGYDHGMVLVLRKGSETLVVLGYSFAEGWGVSRKAGRTRWPNDVLVTRRLAPVETWLSQEEDAAIGNLVDSMPDAGLMDKDALVDWAQVHWFTRWEGPTPMTVCVAPAVYQYMADDCPKLVERTRPFARLATRLFYALDREDIGYPGRRRLPLPYRNYNLGGEVVFGFKVLCDPGDIGPDLDGEEQRHEDEDHQ